MTGGLAIATELPIPAPIAVPITPMLRVTNDAESATL
jgi:hypothetical protein